MIPNSTTNNPILQNFEDGMKDQEKFLKADLKLINTTLTSKLLNLLSDGLLFVQKNISEGYNKSEPLNKEGYNQQCLQDVNSSIDLDFEIYNLGLKYSGCDNLTQSYDKALELIKNTTVLTEELDNLTSVIISKVELTCQNETDLELLKCLSYNVKNYTTIYNEFYKQVLSENRFVNGELMLLTSEESKCINSILEEIHLFITDLESQFENCKN